MGGILYPQMLYTILSISMWRIRSDVTSKYKCRHVREFKADRVIESVKEISKRFLAHVQHRNCFNLSALDGNIAISSIDGEIQNSSLRARS